jgi:hypothetical protein
MLQYTVNRRRGFPKKQEFLFLANPKKLSEYYFASMVIKSRSRYNWTPNTLSVLSDKAFLRVIKNWIRGQAQVIHHNSPKEQRFGTNGRVIGV